MKRTPQTSHASHRWIRSILNPEPLLPGLLLASLLLLPGRLTAAQNFTPFAPTGAGKGGSIPDATSIGENAGNPDAGIFTSDIVLNSSDIISSFNSITIENISHTYAGDLVLQLTHLDTGTSVIFMDRPQKISSISGFGSTSDLAGDFTFITDLGSTFDAPDSIWNALNNTSVLYGGTFAASSNGFSGCDSTSYLPTDLNVFAGESQNGTWRLTIRDEALNDAGCFTGWTFDAGTRLVPEPASAQLIILAGLTYGLRRRLGKRTTKN